MAKVSNQVGTVEWLTPPEIIAAVGPFDLDPCAPICQPYPTAARTFTVLDNGLIQNWSGRVFLNPPYQAHVIGRWMARLAEHGVGTALVNASTDAEWFARHVFEAADALLFIRGRITFRRPDGLPKLRENGRTPATNGDPSVLVAYGRHDLDVLAACEIDGKFVPLRFPRSVLAAQIPDGAKTWRQIIDEFAVGRDGPFPLDDLYRFVRSHPKSVGNRHPEAKARQQLQRGGYRNVDRGLWEKASPGVDAPGQTRI